jgi:hypothetical protein
MYDILYDKCVIRQINVGRAYERRQMGSDSAKPWNIFGQDIHCPRGVCLKVERSFR